MDAYLADLLSPEFARFVLLVLFAEVQIGLAAVGAWMIVDARAGA